MVAARGEGGARGGADTGEGIRGEGRFGTGGKRGLDENEFTGYRGE